MFVAPRAIMSSLLRFVPLLAAGEFDDNAS